MGLIICLSELYQSVRPTLIVFVIKIPVDCNVWRNYLIFIPSFKIIWKITYQSTSQSVNGQPYRIPENYLNRETQGRKSQCIDFPLYGY